MVAESI